MPTSHYDLFAKAALTWSETIQGQYPGGQRELAKAHAYQYFWNANYREIWNRAPDTWSAWAAQLPSVVGNDSMDFYSEYGAQGWTRPDDNWLQFGEKWCNLLNVDLSLFVREPDVTLQDLIRYQRRQWVRIFWQFYSLGCWIEQCDCLQAYEGGKGGKIAQEGGE